MDELNNEQEIYLWKTIEVNKGKKKVVCWGVTDFFDVLLDAVVPEYVSHRIVLPIDEVQDYLNEEYESDKQYVFRFYKYDVDLDTMAIFRDLEVE